MIKDENFLGFEPWKIFKRWKFSTLSPIEISISRILLSDFSLTMIITVENGKEDIIVKISPRFLQWMVVTIQQWNGKIWNFPKFSTTEKLSKMKLSHVLNND